MTAPGKITHCVDLNGSDGKQAVNPPFALVLNQTIIKVYSCLIIEMDLPDKLRKMLVRTYVLLETQHR